MGRKRVMMERGMKNRRYRKTEEKILRVFFIENKKGTTFEKIAKKAGVARATLYSHHHTIREVIPDYRRYVLVEYGRLIKKTTKRKKPSLRALYFETLLFILRNKKVFEMLVEFGDFETLVKIFGKLRLKIISSARLSNASRKIFGIYISEIVGIIVEWIKEGSPEKEIERVLADMIYLAETARERLMPINR